MTENHKHTYVLGFHVIDETKLPLVGGKGANLGELSRINGIRVPEGFCVTTEAYKNIIEQTPELMALLDELTVLNIEDVERVHEQKDTQRHRRFGGRRRAGSRRRDAW